MNRRPVMIASALTIACAALAVGCSAPKPPAENKVEEAKAPPQIQGASYAGARTELTHLGYGPVSILRRPNEVSADEAAFVAKWPEIESCAEMTSACFFYWRRLADGRLLIVSINKDKGDAVIDAWWAREDDVCGYIFPRKLGLKVLPPLDPEDACPATTLSAGGVELARPGKSGLELR